MRVLTISITAIALLMGGYIYWWNTVADTVLAQTENWIKTQQANGYIVKYEPITITGWPYRVKLDITNLVISKGTAEENDNFQLSVPQVWTVVQPWNLTHIIFGVDGTSTYRWQENATTKLMQVTPQSAIGSATILSTGKLDTLAIDLGTVQINLPNRSPVNAERLQLHARPSPKDQKTQGSDATEAAVQKTPAWQIAIRANNLDLGGNQDLPLGNMITKAEISATIDGNITKLTSKSALENWRDKGGIVDIQAANLDWGGSNLAAKGSLTLDSDNYPLGAFTAKIKGFNELLSILGNSRNMDAKTLQTVSFALNLIAKKDDQGVPYLDAPITLQNAALYLGPLKILQLNPVF